MRPAAGQQHRMSMAARALAHRAGSGGGFFTQSSCDRCKGDLPVRTMSWFTRETICSGCSAKEQEIKKALRAKGVDDAMEGCGYIPEI